MNTPALFGTELTHRPGVVDQRQPGTGDRLRRQPAGPVHPLAEPDHPHLPMHLGQAGPGRLGSGQVGHQQPDRVGPTVDPGYPGHGAASDSAGTHGYHEGCPPDTRAIAIARRRGYDLAPLRARLLLTMDFQRFDYILGMDAHNLRAMQSMRPPGQTGYIGRLLDFAPQLGVTDIEDPYYAGERQFEVVLDQVEAAVDGLLVEIRRRLLADPEVQARAASDVAASQRFPRKR